MDATSYARFSIVKDRWADSEQPDVHVDTTQFPSIRSLVETLYHAYLKRRVPPFTYGVEWIITEARNYHHLLAPAAWVKSPDMPAHSIASSWDDMSCSRLRTASGMASA